MAELIDELALDVLPGDTRALAFAHLEACPGCRLRVEELSESADQLLFTYRPVDPPPGFEDRVLGRLGPERARPRPPPRRRSRMLALVAAAAVVVGMAGGAGIVFSQGSGDGTPPLAQGPEMRTVALISASGQRIGDVASYAGAPAWFFLRVDHGADATYQCVLDVDGGSSVSIGPMVVSNGQGGWGEHVNMDAHRVRSARLVNTAGNTIATATFH
jgi:hypothetical protein